MPTTGMTAAERFEVAKKIVNLFNLERYTYLGLSFLTACIVIYVGYQTIRMPSSSASASGLIFGSAGVVTFNIARLLAMFNKILKVVFLSSGDADVI